MRFVRRCAFALPLVIGAGLWLLDPFVARLVLPFREVILALLFVQVLLCTLRFARTRRWTPALVSLAAPALLFGILVFTTEYRVHEQTVTFHSNGVPLVGTLYASAETGPHPAIVLVHGSGKFPRRVYRYWGQQLAQLGFDVLIYDKRGVGDSGGVYEGQNNTSTENINRLASDVSSAVDFVASRPNITQHIGLMGISQGGWIAPLAAQMNPKVKFLILHSGPVVSVREQNLYERLTGEGHGSNSMPIAQAEARVDRADSGGFDPRPVLANLDVRSLWLFGTADQNVPVPKSTRNLDVLIAAGKQFEYKIIPGGDHLLLTGSTRLSGQNSAAYWTAIVDWMKENQNRQLGLVQAPER